MTHQAYKVVDGKEVEHIDPCISFGFRGDTFHVWNGAFGYEYPLAELQLWHVREVTPPQTEDTP